ncbi:MAG: hypothetical protein IBX63_10730 [Coriobacteriia bacterium]|nr:hypothetical protein [Coriobacteriia bacterium]
MGWFGRKRSVVPAMRIEGEGPSVLVTGLRYRRDDLPRAFGALSSPSEHTFSAVLKPQPPNEYNSTPVEVWVNNVHVGWISDDASPRYWNALHQVRGLAYCDCFVQVNKLGDVGKVRLSLPQQL